MAENTPINLRKQTIYSVFVRNYSDEGSFNALESDLDRIKGLGTDIIWLMPIHPTGQEQKKGSLGSPYAISDYRTINSELGSNDDFHRLIDSIHTRGMKIIIDVVYNHTSPDSILAKTHPEWFFHKPDGSFGNKTGDWWDVIDLDYSNHELWDYQISSLEMWVRDYDIDGFRCDVAPMVPLAFWKKSRQAVSQIKPDTIWLAESVEPYFLSFNRLHGIQCHSDSEIFQVFDISYEYDTYPYLESYLTGKISLNEYSNAINLQEGIYPDNYVKLRFIENHDRLRAGFVIRDKKALRNMTAFTFFQKGTTLIYNGQEICATHTPSLFDKDTIDWNISSDYDSDLSSLISVLSGIKHDIIPADSTYLTAAAPFDIMLAIHMENAHNPADDIGSKIFGIFSFKGKSELISLNQFTEFDIQDGIYVNLVDGSPVEINMGHVFTDGEPIIIQL